MRVLLADDQKQVRSALRLLLEHQTGFVVVGEAHNGAELLVNTAEACPDLVLLDWELPGLPVPELLPALRRQRPGLLVLALSGRPEARQAAMKAGADGFVSKGDPPEAVLCTVTALGSRCL